MLTAIFGGILRPPMFIDKSKLKSLGLIKKENKPLKLLGKGTLSKKIKIEVDSASTNAVEAVEKAGGEVIKIA